tara:strand:+ start:4660 stop:6021 length:1362 start_codon:yes stop_codon:yes gene_type:complete
LENRLYPKLGRVAAIVLCLTFLSKPADMVLELCLAPTPLGPHSAAPEVSNCVLYPHGILLGENAVLRGRYPLQLNSRGLALEIASDATGPEFELVTGDHGYFVEVDLDVPPPKKANEFRVLFIGGTAAQGWGATRPENVIAAKLASMLQSRLQGRFVRVINLAMFDHTALQNARGLNRWGNGLEPDLLVAFSGAEDLLVSQETRSDAWRQHVTMNTESFLSRPGEDPTWLRSLAWAFPGIVLQSEHGRTLRRLAVDRFVTLGHERYLSRRRHTQDLYSHLEAYERMLRDKTAARGPDTFRGPEVFRALPRPEYKQGVPSVFSEVSVPVFLHAFKSMKRDLLEIPILLVYQPIDWRSAQPFMWEEYERFRKDTQAGLRDYLNSEWSFLDLAKTWETETLWREEALQHGTWLSDQEQEFVAKRVADEIERSLPRSLDAFVDWKRGRPWRSKRDPK